MDLATLADLAARRRVDLCEQATFRGQHISAANQIRDDGRDRGQSIRDCTGDVVVSTGSLHFSILASQFVFTFSFSPCSWFAAAFEARAASGEARGIREQPDNAERVLESLNVNDRSHVRLKYITD